MTHASREESNGPAASGPSPGREGACAECRRRGWLLSELGPVLDYAGRDVERLLDLLELTNEDLIAAVAGRRRRELSAQLESRSRGPEAQQLPALSLCRHRAGWPRSLARWRGAPHALEARSHAATLAGEPVVAIAGSGRASEYGIELARGLARGLTISGVRVVSAFAPGIGLAAQEGVLEVRGAGLAVTAGGVDVCSPADRRRLHERVGAHGCLISELPAGHAARRWSSTASRRIVAALAQVTVMVEARDTPRGLLEARVARSLGRTVAAVPGRVTSPLAAGPCALLIDGAPLVRGVADVLELLGREEAAAAPAHPRRRDGSACTGAGFGVGAQALTAGQREVLERVGAGADTLGKLTAQGADPSETMLALTELELLGLLRRVGAARYIPRAGSP